MRSVALGLALLLFQGPYDHADEVDAAPQHFRYQRALMPAFGAQGQACAVLDAAVYAHTDGRLSALRIYSGGHDVPFALTESGEAGQQEEPARVMNLEQRGKAIVFDLAMPQRPYTDVALNLDGRDFYATAKVSGVTAVGGPATELGQYVLFDLRSRGLARSTTLALQEAIFPVLHVELVVMPAPGAAAGVFGAQMVRGALVPPSREAQTIYTAVAESGVITNDGQLSNAVLHVPAHVPIERVHIGLDPAYRHDFLRKVTISGRPDGVKGSGLDEEVDGEISRVERPAVDGLPAIDAEHLDIDALLGVDLRQAATVMVTVKNGAAAPLPLRSVALEMRQRKVCFDAAPGAEYVLRYGDAAPVRASVYDYARLFQPNAKAAVVQLGPEAGNPDFRDEQGMQRRSFVARHPQALWAVLLLVIAVLGGVALSNARRSS